MVADRSFYDLERLELSDLVHGPHSLHQQRSGALRRMVIDDIKPANFHQGLLPKLVVSVVLPNIDFASCREIITTTNPIERSSRNAGILKDVAPTFSQ